MSQYIGGDYVLVNYPNTYTFIDNILDFSKDIKDFYLEDQKYERLINFDINTILRDINRSHKNYSSLWDQFILDAKRSNVYINNHYLKPYKLENIENELKYYKNDIDNEKIKQILGLSTQTSYVIPFSIIQSNLNKSNYFLSEISNRKKFKKLNKKMIISINITKKNITVKNNKYLRIFKLENNNDITVSIVKIELEFNLNDPMYSVFKINFNPIY